MALNLTENRPRVGLGVLIFNEKNQILLGKRTTSHGTASFGPPGGHLELGETFEVSALRETKEETGLELPSCHFLALTNDFFEANQKHYISIFMTAAMPKDQEVINTEPQKIEKWDWFDLSNLPTALFLPLKNLLAGNYYQTNANPILELLKNSEYEKAVDTPPLFL